MSLKRTIVILAALAAAVIATTFFIIEEDSSVVQTEEASEIVLEARKNLKRCEYYKAFSALNRLNADTYKLNSRGNISRWVYLHDLAVATYGSGKKIVAMRHASEAIKLYDRLALADSIENIHVPPGEPYFEQMLENLLALKKGKSPSWPACSS